MSRSRFVSLLTFVCTAVATYTALADERVERRRTQLLEQMRSLAEQTKVRLSQGEKEVELVKNPVFRYDDQPRRFIDATVWVWTDGGRPVAFEKIEAKLHMVTDKPQWGYCFTSVSEDLLAVEWSETQTFRTKEPGMAFQPLPEAPAVAELVAQRKRQARELARGFAARVVIDPKLNVTQEMRLLTTPIYEYADPNNDEFLGSVFGLATNGTNPDLLVFLEPRKVEGKPAWHFAPARMTSGGVSLTFREKKVWDCPFVAPREAPFATWTFFPTPRTPVPDE